MMRGWGTRNRRWGGTGFEEVQKNAEATRVFASLFSQYADVSAVNPDHFFGDRNVVVPIERDGILWGGLKTLGPMPAFSLSEF